MPVNALFNPYAAIPSMHVGVRAHDRLAARAPGRSGAFVRVFWFAYPFLITFVTVATATTSWLDAVLGALTAGSRPTPRGWLARARPAVWAFARVREAPAEATA